MTHSAGKGVLSRLPVRRTALIAAAAAIWLLLQLALASWWVTVVLRQADRIAALEAHGGATNNDVTREWARTRFMMIGESSAFLVLLLAFSLLLAWLYWRESRRARAMQAFFAAVTHELRTPLTSIRLQAEAIAEGEQRAELAQRLLQDSHRLESQIEKTLELARIESGGSLSEQAIPLNSWLPHTLDEIAAGFGDRLDLRAHLEGALPAIQADAAALHMILRNLVENSVRHSCRTPVQVRITAQQRGEQLVLEYQDNGAGVAPQMQRLGKLFRRGPNSSGAGVGLYLSRRLMQRMDGRARFNTAPGDGFRAELWFALAQE